MPKPLPPLDLNLISKLAAIDCTDSEIASALGLTKDRFCQRKKKEPELAAALEEGHASARRSLRRLQWEVANKGNPTMLIWLGKNMLGQTDHETVRHEGPGGGPIQYVEVERLPKRERASSDPVVVPLVTRTREP